MFLWTGFFTLFFKKTHLTQSIRWRCYELYTRKIFVYGSLDFLVWRDSCLLQRMGKRIYMFYLCFHILLERRIWGMFECMFFIFFIPCSFSISDCITRYKRLCGYNVVIYRGCYCRLFTQWVGMPLVFPQKTQQWREESLLPNGRRIISGR